MSYKGYRKAKVNWDEVEKLISYQCTQEEVASWFSISVDTLENYCVEDNGYPLSELWSKKKHMGRVRLRKAQMAIVENCGPGSAAMAIWLDKKMNPHENPDKIQPQESQPHQTKDDLGPVDFAEFCNRAGYPFPFSKQIEMFRYAFENTFARMVMGARGYGKTDYLTILGVAYKIYLDPTYKILIISKSKTRNTAIIQEIAQALKANGVKLEKENAHCVRIAGLVGKDHSAEVLTIKSSFRGRHPDLILMDDPVTEEDTSEAMRELVKRKYDEAYKLCSNICLIGQPAHALDLYEELKPSIEFFRVPHGTIPELDADLDAMLRAGVNPASIEMSYHLKIPKDGQTIFSNLKFVDKMPEGETIAFVDPSDGGDTTAITILRAYLGGFAFVGHCYEKAWYHCTDEIKRQLVKHKAVRLIFETNATGTQPIDQLRQLYGGLGIGVVPYNSTTNKHACIVQAGSYAHLLHLSKESNNLYTKQVTNYTKKSKHDDGPDSLARLLEWSGVIRGGKK